MQLFCIADQCVPIADGALSADRADDGVVAEEDFFAVWPNASTETRERVNTTITAIEIRADCLLNSMAIFIITDPLS